MSQAEIPDIQSIVGPTVGALLIGVLFSTSLFGANTLQTWYYYQHYPKDSNYLKVIVAVLWIFEVLHVIFECHAIYFYLVQKFGNLPGLDTTIWSATMTLTITGILILIVHSFFAWRVYILSARRKLIPCIIVGFALAHAGMTWAVVGQSFAAGSYSKFPKSIDVTSTISLVFGVTTDILIASSLGYYLHVNRSGLLKTDKIINKLMFWAVNIGILTSVADFVVLMVSNLTDNLIFLAIYEIVSNLYAASLLATLNLRPFTRENVLDEHGTVVEFGSFQAAAVSSSNKSNTFIAQRSIIANNDSESENIAKPSSLTSQYAQTTIR